MKKKWLQWEWYFLVIILCWINVSWIWYKFDWIQLGLFVFLPLFCYCKKLNWFYFVACSLLGALLGSILHLIPISGYRNNEIWLLQYFDVYYLQTWIINWLKNNYEQSVAQFIGLLLFNDKKDNQELMQQLQNLSVLSLFSISGLHFLLLHQLITKLFFKFKKIGFIFSFLVLFCYWMCLGFSYPGFRSLLSILIFKKFKFQWTKMNLISLYSVLFYNFKIFLTYTFLLSSGITYLIYFVFSYRIQSKFLSWIFLQFLIWFYVSVVFLPITHKWYYFMFLNMWILGPIILVLFVYFWLGWAMLFLGVVHNFLIHNITQLFEHFNLNKFSLYLKFWNYSTSIIAVLIVLAVLLISYWCQQKFNIIKIRTYRSIFNV